MKEVKELQKLRHENKILKNGINLMYKRSVQGNEDRKKLERENTDFRTKALPELDRYRAIERQLFGGGDVA